MNKRDIIIKTALKLFVSYGFHATPTSKIAKEACVATGTLFHYFKTKDELINTIYLDSKENLINSLQSGLSEKKSIKENFNQLFFNTIDWSTQEPNEYLFFQMFSNSPFISEQTKEIGIDRFSFINDLIERGQREKQIKDIDQKILIEILSGAIMGAIQVFLKNYDNLNHKRIKENCFSAIWDMLKV